MQFNLFPEQRNKLLAEQFDLVIQSGSLVPPGGVAEGDAGVRDGQIRGFGAPGSLSGSEVIDSKGLHVSPGVIDTQVHFREIGGEYKEDLVRGVAAAALGGVTNKCRIVKGYDSDFALVDMKSNWEITDGWIASKAGCTPYAGFKASAKPVAIIIRGKCIMGGGSLQSDPLGQPMKFHDTLLAGA